MTLSKAHNLRRNQTDAEQKLWAHLRDSQLAGCKFKRQVPRGAYVVDFACLKRKLIVELDGGQHAEAVQSAKDRQRTAWLESEGYRVLRFWNNDVLTNMEGVLATIAQALEKQKPPHPAPRRLAQALANAEMGEGAVEAKSMPKHDNQTEAEQRLWSHLRDRRLDGHKFRRQVPLGRFIVDFSCYDERLVIELDGSPHGDPARSARDRERTRWLESRGFRVLRFWNTEVLDNMDSVLTRILQELEKR